MPDMMDAATVQETAAAEITLEDIAPAETSPAVSEPEETPAEETICAEAAPEKPKQSIFTRILSVLFGLCGIAAVVAVIFICVCFADTQPILVSSPEDAVNAVTQMLDAVCEGDYAGASSYMLGNPDLGADREPADELGVLFWDAIQESLEYELVGESYATDSGLAQNIRFTFLDLNSLTANLRERSTAMLEQRVEEASDPSEIYDEENNYREDVVLDALYDAAVIAIAEDGKTTTVELTVNLKYQDGQWWIVADKALLDAISGGILF